MAGSAYKRGLALAGMGALVVLALGIVWYGKQPKGAVEAPRQPGPEPGRVGPAPMPPSGGPAQPPGPRGPGRPGGRRGGPRGMFYMGGQPSPEQQFQNRCAERMQRLTGALLMYAMDYDDRLPVAGRWCDELNPYVRSDEFFRCPAFKDGYGFAYNRHLDQRRLSDVAIPARVVGLFESAANAKNAADSGETLCNPPRHPAGNNLGFLDGHFVTTPITNPAQVGWR